MAAEHGPAVDATHAVLGYLLEEPDAHSDQLRRELYDVALDAIDESVKHPEVPSDPALSADAIAAWLSRSTVAPGADLSAIEIGTAYPGDELEDDCRIVNTQPDEQSIYLSALRIAYEATVSGHEPDREWSPARTLWMLHERGHGPSPRSRSLSDALQGVAP